MLPALLLCAVAAENAFLTGGLEGHWGERLLRETILAFGVSAVLYWPCRLLLSLVVNGHGVALVRTFWSFVAFGLCSVVAFPFVAGAEIGARSANPSPILAATVATAAYRLLQRRSSPQEPRVSSEANRGIWLVLLFGTLSIAGFANAVAFGVYGDWWSHLLGSLALTYGLSAAAVAVGLQIGAGWTFAAFVTWAASSASVLVLTWASSGAGALLGGTLAILWLLVVFGSASAIRKRMRSMSGR